MDNDNSVIYGLEFQVFGLSTAINYYLINAFIGKSISPSTRRNREN